MSSSACVRARIASASTGGGGSMPATRTGVPFGASVSPVAVADSFATAAMSPAGTLVTGSCSLPRIANSACSRSSEPVRGFDEVVVGLHGAGQHLEERELADVGVGDRLEDERERLAVRIGGHLLLGAGGDHLDAGTIGG